MTSKPGFSFLIFLVFLALAAGVLTYAAVEQPLMFGQIGDKLKSIITPKAPIGNLTPARDLRGTWVSSLSGKGLQVYGQFNTAGAVTKIYENGDIELKIDKVQNNRATGTMRVYNLCATGQTVAPNIPTINMPRTCVRDSGAQAVSIRVSSSALDFGSYKTGGITFTMQGSYTTDIMSGNMTANVPPYGILKGEFRLMRKRN